MDTKWKNSVRLVVYSLLLVCGLSGLYLLFDQGERYIERDYYDTYQYREQLRIFASFANLLEHGYPTLQEAQAAITVSPQEIADYRAQMAPLSEQMESVRVEYGTLIEQATAVDNSELVEFYMEEQARKLEQLIQLFKDDEAVAAQIRQEKERHLSEIYKERESYLPQYQELRDLFDYYLYRPATGQAYTNMNVQDASTARDELYGSNYAHVVEYAPEVALNLFYFMNFETTIADKPQVEGWIGVPVNSPIVAKAVVYQRQQAAVWLFGVAGILMLAIVLFRFKAMMASVSAVNRRWASSYAKLPLDIKVVAMLLALAVGLIGPISAAHKVVLFVVVPASMGLLGLAATLAVAAIALALTLQQGQALASGLRSSEDWRREWSRTWLRRGFVRIGVWAQRVVQAVQSSFIYRSVGAQLLTLAVIWIGLGYIGGAMVHYYDPMFYMPLLVILSLAGIAAFLLASRQLGHLNRIARAADQLAKGEMPPPLASKGSGVLGALSESIDTLRSGVRLLQHEHAKSERLKTELITNISHDLRTPLTSIITYTGLLEAGEATAEERAAYVGIISQKSKRLKTMIDDLFEVSSMTSGNARLHLERSDLVQLMQQALAEHKETMDASAIQFRISLPERPIFADVDGQKLWRAFDNLIGNMVKYALDHTRAYISMEQTDNEEAQIIFKNISRYEINDSAEELLERFKRGDASRHTEGSGLGLAIAHSIISLHHGILKLETDGDLFKATVILKLQLPLGEEGT
ncbi:two-component sensor histidine kinase [Paenibacillus sp. 598K]|uniref:sensor histidine kinase n=1 Tax=Paenibacillus sp. 598K TaxID=1117987 RepID=UPI000FF9D67B|nr:HAMP domain-containing sensor histidine kinase [Paenibacillus sp. 598K]GBF72277.1 two-component sensor histidine kinase [Paenibacillus sp. 598K]